MKNDETNDLNPQTRRHGPLINPITPESEIVKDRDSALPTQPHQQNTQPRTNGTQNQDDTGSLPVKSSEKLDIVADDFKPPKHAPTWLKRGLKLLILLIIITGSLYVFLNKESLFLYETYHLKKSPENTSRTYNYTFQFYKSAASFRDTAYKVTVSPSREYTLLATANVSPVQKAVNDCKKDGTLGYTGVVQGEDSSKPKKIDLYGQNVPICFSDSGLKVTFEKDSVYHDFEILWTDSPPSTQNNDKDEIFYLLSTIRVE